VKADILAVRHDDDCGQLVNGKYYSPLIDSILDEVQGRAILTVASPNSYRVKARSHAGALSFNGAFVRELFVKRLRSMMGLESGNSDIDTWRAIIRTVQPLYVIGIQPHAALCRACHEQGAFVFDVQHGYIGPKNPGYGAEFQMARDRQEMPDCILCWDEGSATSIRGWTSIKRIDLRVIGNPWINKFVLNRANDKVLQFFQNGHKQVHRNGSRPQIIISLQWGLDNPLAVPNQELFDNDFLPKELALAIKNSHAHYDWIFRPHPVQFLNKEVFRKLVLYLEAHFGPEVIISIIEPLPFLLANVDLHVTYNSSVVIEAEYFGIRSAILDPQIDDGIYDGYFSDQISNGVAELVACTEGAILEWVYSSLDAGKKMPCALNFLPAYNEFLNKIQSA